MDEHQLCATLLRFGAVVVGFGIEAIGIGGGNDLAAHRLDVVTTITTAQLEPLSWQVLTGDGRRLKAAAVAPGWGDVAGARSAHCSELLVAGVGGDVARTPPRRRWQFVGRAGTGVIARAAAVLVVVIRSDAQVVFQAHLELTDLALGRFEGIAGKADHASLVKVVVVSVIVGIDGPTKGHGPCDGQHVAAVVVLGTAAVLVVAVDGVRAEELDKVEGIGIAQRRGPGRTVLVCCTVAGLAVFLLPTTSGGGGSCGHLPMAVPAGVMSCGRPPIVLLFLMAPGLRI